MFKGGGSQLAPPYLYLLMAGPVIAVGDIGLGNRPGDNSLFQEPAEKEPEAAGGAPVEPEGELLQGRQVGGQDRALMATEDPPLKQAGDSVHAWHGDIAKG